jgi:hypothetical protein
MLNFDAHFVCSTYMATESITLDKREVAEEIFDLKRPLIVSNNIEKRDYLEANPTTATGGDLNGSNTITMEVNNTQNYITLFDSYLKIRGKLTKSDGTALGDKDTVEHNWVAGLFKTASLHIGGSKVEEISNVRVATSLLGFTLKSKSERETYGELSGFIPDEVKNTSKDENLGWKRRLEVFSDDDFEVILPLSSVFGFCDIHRILYLIPIRLELVRNDDDRYIFCGTNTYTPSGGSATAVKAKSTISKIQWMIPTIIPSAARKIAINKLLSSTDFLPMTFLKRSLYSIDINESATWIIKTTTAHPRYFILGFKNTTTETPSYTANNGSFDHVNIKELHIDLNGTLYPNHPMKLSFSTRQVSDGYNAYVNFCLKNSSEPCLSLNEWIKFYTIYVIDTSAQAESLRTNSILVQIEIKRDAGSGACRGYALLLEDYDKSGIRVKEGVMSEYA